MISPDFVRLMAAYGAWQNRSLIAASAALAPEERARDRGAFFGSIDKTFRHLLWGDLIWMSRFDGWPLPAARGIADSVTLHPDWDAFRAARVEVDAAIERWAAQLTASALDGVTTWRSGALGRDVTRSTALLVAHFFNHQTHHRGQIHAMLTAAGATPDDTDLFAMPSLNS